MKTILDIEGLPKEVLKKKTVPLYKAFILKDGEEMRIDVNIDVLSISEESALQKMANSLSYDDILDLKGKLISFAVITFDKSELISKPLVDAGEIFYENGSISIMLKDKFYAVAVIDKMLESFDLEVNPKTEIKILSEIKLLKV